MSKTVKEAAWRLILPELRQIVKEELQAATSEIRGEIRAMKGEMQGEFKAVNTRIDEMDKRPDVVQRLAIIEEKVKDMQNRK
ncbi:MAG: hypothetical protein ACRECH_13755 [Nitrososphaerales archaeon]